MKLTKVIGGLSLVAMAVLMASGFVANANDMDSRIESSAKKSFVFKTYLKDDEIVVTSKDGAVTLTGVVEEEYHKMLAENTVEDLPGVKTVTNNLTIKQAPPTASSDAWVKSKVKVALMFHRNVNSSGTDVDVSKGVVTLRGEASSQAQKDLTEEYASDIEGVTRVSNNMKVVTQAPGKKTVEEILDDASIKALTKMTLLFHRSTSALDTSVSVTRGVVTVGGKAANEAEKELVSKLVADVHGVTGVVNSMTVN